MVTDQALLNTLMPMEMVSQRFGNGGMYHPLGRFFGLRQGSRQRPELGYSAAFLTGGMNRNVLHRVRV
jgi:hypothetical protein